MQKSSYVRLKNVLLIILTIAFIIGSPMLYQEKIKQQKEYKRFLNQFYYELESTLAYLDSALSTPSEGDVTRRLMEVDKRLERTNQLLESGNHFVDNSIRTHPYFFMHRINFKVNEDGTLENNQKTELKRIRDALEYIKESLNTGQENRNLSIEEFNKILADGTDMGE